jgi:hypothetical protein
VLIHPDEFAAFQAEQKGQPHPRFDLAALVSAGLGLVLENPDMRQAIYARAVADFKRRSE